MDQAAAPFVSVILTTRDRPRFLRIALACYAGQTYPHRELIVLDDGDQSPASAEAVAAVGGRLIRVETGMPQGAKVNRGVAEARGELCQKMDDDDWYAPQFLEAMVGAREAQRLELCRPTLAFLMPYLFFDLQHWQLRQSWEDQKDGGSLLFDRDGWLERPFRSVRYGVDSWLLLDWERAGHTLLPVRSLELSLSVRHQMARGQRGHVWSRREGGQTIEAHLQALQPYQASPEALLPDWAVAAYGEIRRDSVTDAAAGRAR